MSDTLEDLDKVLSFYHDGENNLAHISAMKFVCDHHIVIKQNDEDAKRFRALEMAIKEWGGDTIPNIAVFLMSRADEILREGEPHDQD